MNKIKQAQRRAERWRSWHTWAGLLSAIVLLNLVITGILLNHTDQLQLNRHHVNYVPLLKWYGFKPPGRATRFYLPAGQLLQLDEAVYLGPQRLFDRAESIIGFCELSETLAIVTQTETTLVTLDGELIETIELPDVLSHGVDRVACTPVGPMIDSGGAVYAPDELFTNWRVGTTPEMLNWSTPELLGTADRVAAYRLYHNRSLTWERLLVDLHSGRLLGFSGVLLVDAAAMLLLLQLLSGVYLFWRKNN